MGREPDLHGQGEYTGEIGPKGELEGATVDLAHPQNKATWHEWAGRRAKCLPFDPNRDIEVTRPKPFDPAPRAGTDFGGSGWTISAIAFEAGFGDLSHFNRSFRRRYGASPSDVRAESLRLTRQNGKTIFRFSGLM